MAEVTGYRIVALQTRIAEVLNQTSEHSSLPEKEQARLLADGCEQACGLLGDWLHGTADKLRLAADVPIKELLPERSMFDEFLGVTLRDALAQSGQYGMTVDVEEVERARKAIAVTVRKKPRAKSSELFKTATDRVGKLQEDVCELARHLKDWTPGSTQGSAMLRMGRGMLKKVAGILPSLVISVVVGMSGAGPAQASHNYAQWGHDAVKVVAVHHIAQSAEPGVQVATAHRGPALR